MSRYNSMYRSGTAYDASGNYWRSASLNHHHVPNSSPKQKSSCGVLKCLTSFYNARIITVEPVIFLFMFAFYFYKVIFELYTFNVYGQQAINDQTHQNHTFNKCLSIGEIKNWTNGTDQVGDTVESEVAHLVLIVGITARLPSALATLILGPLSDRFGRKPTLVINLLGMLLHSVVAIVVVLNHFSVYWFALGAGLRGLCGGIAGIFTACYAYIADVSSKKWLVVRLGLLEAMTFAAGTLSLVAAGVWSQEDGCDFRPMVWVLLGCVVLAVPYTLFLLPESLDKDEIKEETKETKKLKPLVGPKALLRGLQIFFGRGYPRCKLWLLLLVMVVTILNTTGTTAIITLYLLHDPLDWSPLNIGTYQAVGEMMHGLALIFVLPVLVCVGIKDSFITVIGLVLSIGANFSMGFADNTWEVYTIGVFLSVDALILPGVKAMMTKSVQPVDHGALFSFVSAAQVLASVLAYAIYLPVYTRTLAVDWYHASGITFIIMGVLYTLMLPIMMVVMYLQRYNDRRSPPDSPSRSQPNHRVASPSINSPGATERDGLLEDELGQDALERMSFFGSISTLGHSLEQSFQSSGSYRSLH